MKLLAATMVAAAGLGVGQPKDDGDIGNQIFEEATLQTYLSAREGPLFKQMGHSYRGKSRTHYVLVYVKGFKGCLSAYSDSMGIFADRIVFEVDVDSYLRKQGLDPQTINFRLADNKFSNSMWTRACQHIVTALSRIEWREPRPSDVFRINIYSREMARYRKKSLQ